VEEEPEELLFTMTVDDNLDWQEDGEEIGVFDCGGCNHGVYRMNDGGYQYAVHDVQDVLCSRMRSNADFSVCQVSLLGKTWVQRNYGLNNALMMAFSFASAQMGTMLMHASVIRCDGRGYLMTAPSGTGKSTHTRLWYDNIPGCDLMNDDNPVVRIIDGHPIVFGSPWSGKTPCYRNIKAPLGGIALINRAESKRLERQRPIDAFITLLPACSTMKWDERIYRCNGDTVTKLIETIPVYTLHCLPDRESAVVASTGMKAGVK
jgi:hypothetical protein